MGRTDRVFNGECVSASVCICLISICLCVHQLHILRRQRGQLTGCTRADVSICCCEHRPWYSSSGVRNPPCVHWPICSIAHVFIHQSAQSKGYPCGGSVRPLCPLTNVFVSSDGCQHRYVRLPMSQFEALGEGVGRRRCCSEKMLLEEGVAWRRCCSEKMLLDEEIAQKALLGERITRRRGCSMNGLLGGWVASEKRISEYDLLDEETPQ